MLYPAFTRRNADVRPSRWTGLLSISLLLPVLAAAGCSRAAGPLPQDPGRPVIRIASFDFAESRALAAVYADGLRGRGYPVSVVDGLGSREVVEPALEQDVVDFVPEYTGTALRFLTEREVPASADPQAVHQELRNAFSGRGVAVLEFAPAEDKNGIVVTSRTAAARGLRRISDLRTLAGRLTFGGPAECPQRPLCLPGLRQRYGLDFGTFRPMPSRAVTVEALEAGEIDVGLLETTDPRLAGGGLTLLEDDLGLQPPENVVPVVRQHLVGVYGPAFVAAVNEISATLTTAALVRLNQEAGSR